MSSARRGSGGRARGRGGIRSANPSDDESPGRRDARRVRFNTTNSSGSASGAPRGPSRPSTQSTGTLHQRQPRTNTPPVKNNAFQPRTNESSSRGSDGSYYQRYQMLKKQREQERADAIANGFLADPDRPRTLAEAITPIGTCQDMCPEFERVERAVQKDVWMPEADPQSLESGPPYEPMEARMVKKFRRSAAGIDEQLPSDLRPPQVLQGTLNYLIDDVVSNADDIADVHHFLWDRTRAIRNDLSIQQVSKIPDLRKAIDCFERIARFHILTLHLCARPLSPSVRYDWQQDREQLDKTMASLVQYYDDSRDRYRSSNEAEFRAYCIIFCIQDQFPDLEDRIQRWPADIVQDSRVQTALKLYTAACNIMDPQGPLRPRRGHAVAQQNWQRFWKLVVSSETSYLMSCAAEMYFNLIRRMALNAVWQAYRQGGNTRTEDWTLMELVYVLGFDTEDEVESFCGHYGFAIRERADGKRFLDLNSVQGRQLPESSTPSRRQSMSHRIVEPKRHGRTMPAIINGLSVRAAQQAGLIEESGAQDQQANEAEEQSLFVTANSDEEDDMQAKKQPTTLNAQPSTLATPPLNPFTSPFAPIPAGTSTQSLSFGKPSFPSTDSAGVAAAKPNPFSLTPSTSATNTFAPVITGNGSTPFSFSTSTSFDKPTTFGTPSLSTVAKPSDTLTDTTPAIGFGLPSSTATGTLSEINTPLSAKQPFSFAAPDPGPHNASATASPFTMPSSSKPAFSFSQPSSTDLNTQTLEPSKSPIDNKTTDSISNSAPTPFSFLTKPLASPPVAGAPKNSTPNNEHESAPTNKSLFSQPQNPSTSSSTAPTSSTYVPSASTVPQPNSGFSGFSLRAASSNATTIQSNPTPLPSFNFLPVHSAADLVIDNVSSLPTGNSPSSLAQQPQQSPKPFSFLNHATTLVHHSPAVHDSSSTQPSSSGTFQGLAPTQNEPQESASVAPAPSAFPISSTPQRSPAAPTTTILQSSPSRPSRQDVRKSNILDSLAEKVVTEPNNGLLKQFIEFKIGPMVLSVLNEYQAEVARQEADEFRRKTLSLRYGRMWVNLAYQLRMKRQGRQRRERMAAQRAAMAKQRQGQRSSTGTDLSAELAEFKASHQGNRKALREDSLILAGGSSSQPPPNKESQLQDDDNLGDGLIDPITGHIRPSVLRHRRAKTQPDAPILRPVKGSHRVSKPPPREPSPSLSTLSGRSSLLGYSFLSGDSLLGKTVEPGARMSTTKSDYFRLKALGVDPNGDLEPSPLHRKRSRDEDEEDGSPHSKRVASPSEEKGVAATTFNGIRRHPTSLGTQKSHTSSGITSQPSPSCKRTRAEIEAADEALFARARAAMKGLDEGIGFYREEIAKEEQRQRSASLNSANGVSPAQASRYGPQQSPPGSRPAYWSRVSKFVPREDYGKGGKRAREQTINAEEVSAKVESRRIETAPFASQQAAKGIGFGAPTPAAGWQTSSARFGAVNGSKGQAMGTSMGESGAGNTGTSVEDAIEL